ncbi:E3 ubiquitin-protein ligase ZNF598-like [Limulus polyphemus]|uniref:RING-type E3 ubiquitin transferase n=1 Tax=Limulus polyphemus TaxID=6850 RepID=A0ABM1BHW0_LIMPO|nr:E3 ubiquitin-protein ligase ZNF598-like [Limulus polyphemus]
MNSNDLSSDDNCVVCCRKLSIFAVGICDHPVCHECSTRMRVLCRQNECPICRRETPKVIFTRNLHPFAELSKSTYPMDQKYKIMFADKSVQSSYEKLLQHVCGVCHGKSPFRTFNLLKEHMKRYHELFYCELCVEHLRIFSFERKCYTRRELGRHRRTGDTDDTSHRGHPLCEFCEERFLDSDELFRHLRRMHYFCHFCDADGLHQFYSDYEELRRHFRNEHYLCEEDSCRDEKFTSVFRNEIDLKAHKAQNHSKNMTKMQAKQSRTLELEFTITPRNSKPNGIISAADYEDFHTQNRRGRRGNQRGQPNTKSQRQEGFTASDQPARSEKNINTKCEKEFPQLSTNFTKGATLNNDTGSMTTNDTMANRLAKANRFTIRTGAPLKAGGRMNLTNTEEFPTLGSTTIQIPSQSCQSSSQVTVTSKPESPVSPGTRKTLLFRINSQEEGNNSSKRRAPNVSIQVSRTQNVIPPDGAKNSVADSGTMKKVSSYQNIMLQKPGTSVTTSSLTSVSSDMHLDVRASRPGVKPSWVSTKTASHGKFDDEFPQLGETKEVPQSLTNNAWSSVTIPVSSCDVPVTESGDTSKPAMVMVKNKSKKKKQKPVNTEINIKEKNETNKKKKKETEFFIGEDNEKINCSSKCSIENQENEDPGCTQEQESITDLKKSSEENPKITSSDSTEELTQQTKSLAIEDFPPLDVPLSKKPPTPPGFSSKTSNVITPPPPPGFDSGQSVVKPSVNISLSSVARQLTCTSSNMSPVSSMTFISSSGQTFPLSTQPTIPNHNYTQPIDFQERNHALIQAIQVILDGNMERFRSFKTFSGHFRQNLISAQEYFENCLDILGKAEFIRILPELVVLLPDINKQQELLIVLNNFKKSEFDKAGGAIPKNNISGVCYFSSIPFLVCATCQQVLAKEDFHDHMAVHNPDTDNLFPPLSAQSATTRISWVKK